WQHDQLTIKQSYDIRGAPLDEQHVFFQDSRPFVFRKQDDAVSYDFKYFDRFKVPLRLCDGLSDELAPAGYQKLREKLRSPAASELADRSLVRRHSAGRSEIEEQQRYDHYRDPNRCELEHPQRAVPVLGCKAA